MIAHKKGDIRSEVEKAGKAIGALGGQLKEVRPVTIPELPDNRSLVVIEKVSRTPEKYPRRAGLPAKRPID